MQLLLGTGTPVMTPDGIYFSPSFLSYDTRPALCISAAVKPFLLNAMKYHQSDIVLITSTCFWWVLIVCLVQLNCLRQGVHYSFLQHGRYPT